ncbi:hypothetical protein [Halobacteriovorax sp. HLS]|uniref:hypothetical protein n=1 Tax=Halobacteriovorax sp. HLS TaxID=2234000 RepID=UPI000FDC4CF5|nr:hypothetical protein [Halobacteriovorax sp. HLS]
MKKNALIFFIGISAVAVVFYLLLKTDQELNSPKATRSQTPHIEKKLKKEAHLGEEILNSEIKHLAKQIEKSISNSEYFNSLNDYRKKPEEIIKSFSATELKNYLINLSSELNNCLKKDFCDTKPDADGYFDENQTPAHKLLGRSLLILNKSNDDLQEDIPFLDFLSYNNEDILVNTSELFLKSSPTQDEFDDFLKKTRGLQGGSKSIVYKTLLMNKNDPNRSYIIEEFTNQIKDSEPNTIISFFQSIKGLNLSEEELEKLASASCQLKENQITWNSFSHHFNKYSEEMGYSLSASQICL